MQDTSLRRDDIVLSAELQAGAVKFDVEAKNKIALREKAPPDES